MTDVNELIIEYIKVLTSWPIMLFIVVVIFKREVGNIIERLSERITSAEIVGQKFGFSTNIDEQSKMISVLDNVLEKNPDLMKESLRNADVTEDSFKSYRSFVKDNFRQAQKFLKEMGYKIDVIDGISGPNTREATRQFQRDHNLYPDGIIGLQTLRKIWDIQRLKKKSQKSI